MTEKLNEQFQKLNEQIDVQKIYNSSEFRKAQEMTHSTIDGYPIAKIHGSSSAILPGTVEGVDDSASGSNQPVQDISRDDNVRSADEDSNMSYTLHSLMLFSQIDEKKDYFSALFNEAQEMAHSLPEGHPSNPKIQWSSEPMLEIYILRNQLDDTAENTDNLLSDSNKLMQVIKYQERLLELYNGEIKRMAAIKENLKAALNISDHVADAEET